LARTEGARETNGTSKSLFVTIRCTIWVAVLCTFKDIRIVKAKNIEETKNKIKMNFILGYSSSTFER